MVMTHVIAILMFMVDLPVTINCSNYYSYLLRDDVQYYRVYFPYCYELLAHL